MNPIYNNAVSNTKSCVAEPIAEDSSIIIELNNLTNYIAKLSESVEYLEKKLTPFSKVSCIQELAKAPDVPNVYSETRNVIMGLLDRVYQIDLKIRCIHLNLDI